MLVTAWVGQAEEVDPGHDGGVAFGRRTDEVGVFAEAEYDPDENVEDCIERPDVVAQLDWVQQFPRLVVFCQAERGSDLG